MGVSVGVCTSGVRAPLNEQLGFKRPTRAIARILFRASALLSGTAQWTSGVGWSFRCMELRSLGVARGIKGKGHSKIPDL